MKASSIAMTSPGPRAATSSSSVRGWLHTYKNQELQYNTNGVTTFNSSNFSERLLHQLHPRHGQLLFPVGVPRRASTG